MIMPAVLTRRLLVLTVAAATISGAYAGTITGLACAQQSFTAYKNLSAAGCNSGPIQLFSFNLFTVVGNVATVAPTSLTDVITVNPQFFVSEGSFNDMRMIINGFQAFPVAANVTQSYRIDFTGDPAPIMSSMETDFDPPFGTNIGTVVYCGDPADVATGCLASGSFSFSSIGGTNTPGSARFPFLLTTLRTQTTFTLNPNGNTPSGIDGVVFDIFTASATPEPATWLLAASGLALAAFRRRTRRG